MKKYEFRPDVAISDIAFYAYGRTLAEVIANACLATVASMADIRKIRPIVTKIVHKSAKDPESLLYSVLEEVVYLKDAEQLLFGEFVVDEVCVADDSATARVTMKGEKIDRQRHGVHADVKAVTYQGFKIEKAGKIWRASVTLDI
jgi:SHS2 domain-containing protein